MNELTTTTTYSLAQYIIEHASELKDKVIEITDINELSRYNTKPLYHKYLQNSLAGYELTTPDNKVRMIVSDIRNKDGFRTGFKVEKVEKLLNYQRQLHYDINPNPHGILAYIHDDDFTIIDYIKNNNVSDKTIFISSGELNDKFIKVNKNKYVPNTNKNAYIIVEPYNSKYVVKQAVENLCIPTVVYDGSKLTSDKNKIVISKAKNGIELLY